MSCVEPVLIFTVFLVFLFCLYAAGTGILCSVVYKRGAASRLSPQIAVLLCRTSASGREQELRPDQGWDL